MGILRCGINHFPPAQGLCSAPIFKDMARKKKTTTKKTEYIFHSGDNLYLIAQELTGHKYLLFRLLEKSGKTLNSLKDGDILKWGN